MVVILIGVGSNLPVDGIGAPLAVVRAAVAALAGVGVEVVAVSPWYRSAPVPLSAQPWYVNGVLRVATRHDPAALLAALHRVEADFGRRRRAVNEARGLDLDLLAYGDLVLEQPCLPHPRLDQRAFVLLPLRDLLPDWRHPLSGLGVGEMIAALPPGQRIEPVPPGEVGGAV